MKNNNPTLKNIGKCERASCGVEDNMKYLWKILLAVAILFFVVGIFYVMKNL